MLLRLSKLYPGTQRAALSASGLLLAGLYAACGGAHFTAGPADSANAGLGWCEARAAVRHRAPAATAAAATRPTPASGGADEWRELARAARAQAAAGSSTVGCATCDTSRGNYCDVNKKCPFVHDFARLEFAAPQPLTLSHSGTSSERFPRPANVGSSLFYTEDALLRREMWFTAAPTSGIGAFTSELGSGPLLAPGFSESNFFFDRQEVTTGVRKLWTANWDGAALSKARSTKIRERRWLERLQPRGGTQRWPRVLDEHSQWHATVDLGIESTRAPCCHLASLG